MLKHMLMLFLFKLMVLPNAFAIRIRSRLRRGARPSGFAEYMEDDNEIGGNLVEDDYYDDHEWVGRSTSTAQMPPRR